MEPDDFEFAEVQKQPWHYRFWPAPSRDVVLRNARHPSPGGEGYRRGMRRTGLTILVLGVAGIVAIALLGALLDWLV
ncbi:MAG: hypothetical protein KDB06_08205 [Ilumatobacter sp.]|nr:hypothetical protein [Ilumatobacter sp.]MCB0984621.1 hypothetical protein [Ilumatobacter sp.]